MARKKLKVQVRGSRKHVGYTKHVPDKGAEGRTPKSKQWAEFNHESGWKKSDSQDKRISTVIASEDKRLNQHDRRLAAGRGLLQLSNITTDNETRQKAKLDYKKIFNSLR